MRSILLFHLILLYTLFTACSAPTVFELKPTTEEISYNQGREIIYSEDSTSTILLNFEHQEGDNFSFYTEITSNSQEPILVDPSLFYAVILEPKENGISNIMAVVNPETKIKTIQEEIVNTESSKGAAIGMNVLLGLFNVAVDIASDSPPGKVFDDAVFWGANAEAEASEHDAKEENLINLKRYWEDKVLRKTSLNQDEYIGGIFYLPIHTDTKLLKLIIPVNGNNHEFTFIQNSIY